MRRPAFYLALLSTLALVGLAGQNPLAGSSFAEKLKQKAKQRLEQRENQAAQKVVDETEEAGKEAAKPDAEAEVGAEAEAAPDAEAKPAAEAQGQKGGKAGLSQISTKFDFVPGSKVLFFDDFSQTDVGEFPQRWKLFTGTFDVVEYEGKRWLHLDGEDGSVAMKVDAFPERWTLEFDVVGECLGTSAAPFEAYAMNGPTTSNYSWYAHWGHCPGNVFRILGAAPTSEFSLSKSTGNGPNHVAFMGSGTGVKIYFNDERVVNVPEVEGARIQNLLLRFRKEALITNVRYAEGGKPVKEQLAGGKLVTHGILFDTGSDRIEPASAPVLRQIAAVMQADPSLKLRITGHTDDVGSKESNMALSARRAEAVRNALSSDFGIDAGRLETGGKGDTEPMAANSSPESRAMNRRVEFVKI